MIIDDFVTYNNRYICYPWDYQGMLGIPMHNNRYYALKWEDTYQYRKYGCFTRVNDSIILAPYNNDMFSEYSITENKFIYYNNPYFISDSKNSFICACEYENSGYFAGITFPGIVKFSLPERKWLLINSVENSISGNMESIFSFTRGTARIGSKIYFLCNQQSGVVEVDLLDDKAYFRRFNDSNFRFSDMTIRGNELWLAPRIAGQPLCIWNVVNNNIRYLNLLNVAGEEIENENSSPWRIVSAGDFIIMVPLAMNNQEMRGTILRINANTLEINTLKIYDTNESICAWLVKIVDNKLIINNSHQEEYFIVDYENLTVAKWELHPELSFLCQSPLFSVIEESLEYDVSSLIKLLSEDNQ